MFMLAVWWLLSIPLFSCRTLPSDFPLKAPQVQVVASVRHGEETCLWTDIALVTL